MTIVNCADCHQENCKYQGSDIRSTCWAFREKKTMTNFDKIHSMGVEDFAEFLSRREIDIAFQFAKITGCAIKNSPVECYKNLLHWLKQEASQ